MTAGRNRGDSCCAGLCIEDDEIYMTAFSEAAQTAMEKRPIHRWPASVAREASKKAQGLGEGCGKAVGQRIVKHAELLAHDSSQSASNGIATYVFFANRASVAFALPIRPQASLTGSFLSVSATAVTFAAQAGALGGLLDRSSSMLT